jgi:hypothetical protein
VPKLVFLFREQVPDLDQASNAGDERCFSLAIKRANLDRIFVSIREQLARSKVDECHCAARVVAVLRPRVRGFGPSHCSTPCLRGFDAGLSA